MRNKESRLQGCTICSVLWTRGTVFLLTSCFSGSSFSNCFRTSTSNLVRSPFWIMAVTSSLELQEGGVEPAINQLFNYHTLPRDLSVQTLCAFPSKHTTIQKERYLPTINFESGPVSLLWPKSYFWPRSNDSRPEMNPSTEILSLSIFSS